MMGYGESPKSVLLVLRPPLFDVWYRMMGDDLEGAAVVAEHYPVIAAMPYNSSLPVFSHSRDPFAQ